MALQTTVLNRQPEIIPAVFLKGRRKVNGYQRLIFELQQQFYIRDIGQRFHSELI